MLALNGQISITLHSDSMLQGPIQPEQILRIEPTSMCVYSNLRAKLSLSIQTSLSTEQGSTD